jgi:hypothetical protein
MTNKNIISKIEKLLALAGNNPSEAEAQAAMLKAQKLMAEHNLDMSTFKEAGEVKKEVEQVWVKGGHNCNWMIRLAQVVAENFRCNLLRGTGYGLVFIGLKEDVAICTQVFNFASHTMDRNMTKLRRQYRKQGLSTEGISGDYAMGFISGLRDKFKEQVENNNWGLVLVKDNAVMEYTEKVKNPKGKGSSGKPLKRSGDPTLYAKGYLDGKSLADPQKAITA